MRRARNRDRGEHEAEGTRDERPCTGEAHEPNEPQPIDGRCDQQTELLIEEQARQPDRDALDEDALAPVRRRRIEVAHRGVGEKGETQKREAHPRGDPDESGSTRPS